jgi:hypothetical protein
MKPLNKHDVWRLLLQGVSIIYGLLGFFWFYFISIIFLIPAIRNRQPGWFFFFFITFSLLGAFLVYVAYDMIRKFSVNSIKHLCIVIGLMIYGYLSHILKLFEDRILQPDNMKHDIIIGFAPIVLAYLSYWILSRLFVKLTGLDNIQQTPSPCTHSPEQRSEPR